MKYTVYCTARHITKEGGTTVIGKAHNSKHCVIEADGILDAMARFSKEERSLINSNKRLGWTITETINGYTEEKGNYSTTYSDFRFIAENNA